MFKKIDPLLTCLPSVSFRLNPISPTTTMKKRFISKIYYNRKLEDRITLVEPKTHVDLSCWNLIDHDTPIIIKEVITDKQCSELWLCGNKITSQGAAILALGLANNSTLQCLDLSYNRISDKGVHFLSQALLPNRHSLLEILFLNKNGISSDGAKYLSEILRTNQNLTELWLSENEIGNEGIKLLANALIHHNKTLKVLVVSFNLFITDLSIDYLLEMLEHNQTLEKLSINNCNLSEAGKMKLREKADKKRNFEIDI